MHLVVCLPRVSVTIFVFFFFFPMTWENSSSHFVD